MFDTRQKCMDALRQIECQSVHIEDLDESERLAWKRFIQNLENGDTAVFFSLSNAFRSYTDFIFFVKLCDKKHICIRSIIDNLDSSNIATGNTLKAITKLPIHTSDINYMTSDFEADMETNNAKVKMQKRHRIVINMYNAGYCTQDILEKSRYRSRTSIYRILNKYGIELEYPSMSRKQNKAEEKT